MQKDFFSLQCKKKCNITQLIKIIMTYNTAAIFSLEKMGSVLPFSWEDKANDFF